MIFVFLAGGPSQADLFAPKPYITRKHGQAIASPVGDDGQLRVGVATVSAHGASQRQCVHAGNPE